MDVSPRSTRECGTVVKVLDSGVSGAKGPGSIPGRAQFVSIAARCISAHHTYLVVTLQTVNFYNFETVFSLKAQNETSTSQKLTNLQIVDLSASITCRCQLLGCCDQLAEGVSRFRS